MLELQQIIGRGRGLWRTADNPLHVLVLTDVPLDMPVEELTTDAAERPSFEDRQIAVGAIAFECAAHAAKAFPEMWKDAELGAVCAPRSKSFAKATGLSPPFGNAPFWISSGRPGQGRPAPSRLQDLKHLVDRTIRESSPLF